MKNSKIRRALLLAACAVLLVVMSVGATLAYLTDKDSVTNTFTVGKVDIKLDEAKVDADGKAVIGENAERVKANQYHLLPGLTYDKDPMVTVIKGSEESYIRMIVTINKKAELDAIGVNALAVFAGYDSTKWVFEKETAGNDNTMVYEFRYHETVDTYTATADKALEPLFTQIVMPGDITNAQLLTLDAKYDAEGKETEAGLTIDVVAQAIQAAGFNSDDEAWAAFPTAE